MAYSDRDRVSAWFLAGFGEKLTTLDRGVLLVIAERANATSGLSAPGTDELARYWGVHPESVIRSIARLHKLGLVDTVTRGRGQHRARYVLAGELAKLSKVAQPTGRATSPTENPSSPTENPSSPTDGLGVLSESSRSSSEVMTTPSEDGAPRAALTGARAPDEGSAPRGPSVSDAVLAEVAEALGVEDETARRWSDERLGRAVGPVKNRDAYVRQALGNYLADKKRAAAKIAKVTALTPLQALERIAKLAGSVVEHDDIDLDNYSVDVVRGGLSVAVYIPWGESDKLTIAEPEHSEDDLRWPAAEWPDYFTERGQTHPVLIDGVEIQGVEIIEPHRKPAEAVALVERFLADAERLGFAS